MTNNPDCAQHSPIMFDNGRLDIHAAALNGCHLLVQEALPNQRPTRKQTPPKVQHAECLCPSVTADRPRLASSSHRACGDKKTCSRAAKASTRVRLSIHVERACPCEQEPHAPWPQGYQPRPLMREKNTHANTTATPRPQSCKTESTLWFQHSVYIM